MLDAVRSGTGAPDSGEFAQLIWAMIGGRTTVWGREQPLGG